jgi:hypothetical protein
MNYLLYATGINSDDEFYFNSKFKEICDAVNSIDESKFDESILINVTKELSLKYNDVLFVLCGRNEKFENQWKQYFCNGKTYKDFPKEIIKCGDDAVFNLVCFPKFNINKCI